MGPVTGEGGERPAPGGAGEQNQNEGLGCFPYFTATLHPHPSEAPSDPFSTRWVAFVVLKSSQRLCQSARAGVTHQPGCGEASEPTPSTPILWCGPKA